MLKHCRQRVTYIPCSTFFLNSIPCTLSTAIEKAPEVLDCTGTEILLHIIDPRIPYYPPVPFTLLPFRTLYLITLPYRVPYYLPVPCTLFMNTTLYLIHEQKLEQKGNIQSYQGTVAQPATHLIASMPRAGRSIPQQDSGRRRRNGISDLIYRQRAGQEFRQLGDGHALPRPPDNVGGERKEKGGRQEARALRGTGNHGLE